MSFRRGFTTGPLMLILSSLVIIGGLSIWMYLSQNTQTSDQEILTFYCAAGMKKPVSKLAEQFEKELGIQVQLQYGGSGTLLANLQVAKRGDLYLAADSSYIDIAREKDLVAEAIPLAKMRAVIAVKKGNPKKINTLDDLLNEEVSFALANPEAASIGKLTKKLLSKAGKWEAFEKRKKVFKPTVNDIASDVDVGAVDAAIIWDALAKQFPGLEAVHVPLFDAEVKNVTVGVLNSCENPTTALKFARYLQAPERGGKVFKEHGFETVNGDLWSERPSLTFYSGGVNRLAIQETLKEFEKREGIELNVIYNGCGVLVGMMETITPDAYFACDLSYLQQVKEKFGEPLVISETEMVIVTPKDDEHEIDSLKKLTQKDLKIGVTNEKQSALGTLTQSLLESVNLYDDVQKNVVVTAPTADLLVNQLLAGDLDAIIVYRVNVSQVKGKVKVIEIKEGDSTAVQPLAIAKKSQLHYLTERLRDAITSAKSEARFKAVDFRSLMKPGNKEKNSLKKDVETPFETDKTEAENLEAIQQGES